MMTEAMVNHGLPEPELREVGTCLFEVSLIGRGESLENLKITRVVWRIPDATKKKLNERQSAIIEHLNETGSVTGGWCRKQFEISYDTANRDVKGLLDLGIVIRRGKGRSAHYVLLERIGDKE